jgi:hypothetical protein
MRYGKRKKQITIQLDNITDTQLTEISKLSGKSKSSLIRHNTIQFCNNVLEKNNLQVFQQGILL